MSQVRKTTFITLAFLFSAGLLSGCGISGPLYAPGTGPDAAKAKSVATPAVESVDNNVASKTPSSEAE
ncbi:lipoprotein [Moritella marina ATCC 15381]|uniref:Lipoprotein n=1 Tax=Moritella marina ATCC 15381 TaxID=1202962 RepID=A0A5J6WSV6_MORMI|nr:lipoprotein [Moritella marina]QFI39492.1 lipoprotein [Moritella marina ATCC 15381]